MSKKKFIKSIEVSLNEEFLRDNKIDKTFLRNFCRNAVISESNDGKIRIRGNYEEIKELHQKLQKNTSAQDMSSGAHSQIKEAGISADTRSDIAIKTMSVCNGLPCENKKDANQHFKKSVNSAHAVTGRPSLSTVRGTKSTRDNNNITNGGDRRKGPTKKKSEVVHKSPERKRIKYRDEDTSFTNRFQKLNIKKSDRTDQIDGPESFSMLLDMPRNQHYLPAPANSTSQPISTFREQRQCLETEPHGMIQGISHELVTLRPSLRSDTMNSFNESPSASDLQNGRNSELMRKSIFSTAVDSIINYPSYLSYQSNFSSKTITEDRSPTPMDSIANLPSHQSDLSYKMIRENRSLNSNTDSFIKLPLKSLGSESIIQDASHQSKDVEESFIVLDRDSFSCHED